MEGAERTDSETEYERRDGAWGPEGEAKEAYGLLLLKLVRRLDGWL